MHISDLLESRMQGKSDQYHLALSVEGGMMRGSITAGMIEALHEDGAEQLFDSYWGSSIGALNAAYLAGGDTAGRAELYAQSTKHLFRDRMHPLHGWIDLDWLFRVGFRELQPLPFHRLHGSPLRFLVTRAGWWEARDAVSEFQPSGEAEWRYLLEAATRAPIAAGLPLGRLRGGLWDAAVWENWPQQTPLKDGATHLLVLRSTPPDVQRSRREKLWMKGTNWFFCTPSYLEQEQALRDLETSGRAAQVQPREQIVALDEKDPALLREAAAEGKRAWQEFWRGFDRGRYV